MIRSLWAALRAQIARGRPDISSRKVLVVVEGKHDVEFLRRVSTALNGADASLPDLAQMEGAGKLIFIPCCGGDILAWANRLAGLRQVEFHLYDREAPPETDVRQQAARIVNVRPHCRAFVTKKRALENYLAPSAIHETSGLEVHFSDDDDVADLVAHTSWSLADSEPPWELLPGRARKRLRERTKRWLNTHAADRMTAQRIDQCDPAGEIRGWLQTIAWLAREAR
jgi:putative ATP-dependent endonuclease of OLD family